MAVLNRNESAFRGTENAPAKVTVNKNPDAVVLPLKLYTIVAVDFSYNDETYERNEGYTVVEVYRSRVNALRARLKMELQEKLWEDIHSYDPDFDEDNTKFLPFTCEGMSVLKSEYSSADGSNTGADLMNIIRSRMNELTDIQMKEILRAMACPAYNIHEVSIKD